MAKDKERSLNPAQAQRKADKAKALKKARNEQQAKRNEKLARRNPDRIQRQIDDLKALEASGEIKPREQAILADLERDLKAVHKAREVTGQRSSQTDLRSRQPTTRRDEDRAGHSSSSVLGKRQRDGQRRPYHNNQSFGSETDESVRNIPMPRDTPPPAPRHQYRQDRSNGQTQTQTNTEQQSSLPNKPTPAHEAKTVYSSAPQLRDLTKEAVSRFIPDIVRRKQDAAKGQGGLLEPEELDRLEKEGYYGKKDDVDRPHTSAAVTQYDEVTEADEQARRLQDEEARFQRELAETMDIDQDQDQQRLDIHSMDHRTLNANATTTTESISLGMQNGNQKSDHIGDKEEDDKDEEEDEEDDYLPPLMSGKPSISKPNPSSQSSPPTSFPSTGSAIAAGLFSKLPKPKNDDGNTIPKHAHMEDVEDEES